MKKEKLFRAMSLVDDKYVDEAAPQDYINNINKKKKPMSKRKLIIALAAAFTFIVSLSLWLFIPLKDPNADVTRYEESEYYDIIQKLHAVGYRQPRYKNNFELYLKKPLMNFAPKKDSAIEDAGNFDYNSVENTTGTYKEVTDNQVEGVIEADLIKRTDKHIFYLDGLTLRAFSIEGEESHEVGAYSIRESTKDGFVSYGVEFYLSLDGKSITLVLPHPSASEPFVSIERIDVSDPANMKAVRGFCVSGEIRSTRMTDGEFIVLTNFYPKMNFSRPENFVPSVGDTQKNMEALPIECLYVPNDVTNASYTVITRLDANTLEHKDTYSLLSYSDDVYVSSDKIFTWRGMDEKIGLEDDVEMWKVVSEIVAISYKDTAMKFLGTIKLDGSIKDQYSLDEYNGILRVVTSIDEDKYQTEKRYGDAVASMLLDNVVSASLYCIDLSTWQIAASVDKFAPKDENVRSVRFEGNNAYVCTAVQLKDPVFFFDLSDINNITYKETGTIEGFSTSLVDFAEGYLLGIGVGSMGTLKIEVYEEIDDKVVSVCKYEPQNTYYSNDYKSYYIDRENGLIGLGTYRHRQYSINEYTVLSFKDRALTEEIQAGLEGTPEVKRGVYIDGYFYMFGKNDFKVEKLDINK